MSEFVDRLLNALGGRVEKVKGIWDEPVGVDPSRPVRMLGQVAGGASDVLGEVMRAGYRGLVPQSSQDKFSDAMRQVAQTPVGRFAGDALIGAVSAYRGFSERNPKTAGSLDALANLSDFTPKGVVSSALGHAMIPMVGEIRGLKHGSGYKFDKFSDEFIGKGEGAQSFGHGHYLTEDENIAKSYSTSGSLLGTFGKGVRVGDEVKHIMKYPIEDTPETFGVYALLVANGDKEKAKGLLGSYFPQKEAKEWIDKNIKGDSAEIVHSGNVYDVTVNKGKPSNEDVFLEWDKPVPSNVASKLSRDIAYFYPGDNPHRLPLSDALNRTTSVHKTRGGEDFIPTGANLYNEFSNVLGSDILASSFLNRAGFTGIKYPSGMLSGIKDSPYSNYVIFDPNRITIEGVRNGR